jgi:hypothetical protein
MLLARPLHRVLRHSRIVAALHTSCTSSRTAHLRLCQPATASKAQAPLSFCGTTRHQPNNFAEVYNLRGTSRLIALSSGSSSSQGPSAEAGDSIAAVKRQVGPVRPDSSAAAVVLQTAIQHAENIGKLLTCSCNLVAIACLACGTQLSNKLTAGWRHCPQSTLPSQSYQPQQLPRPNQTH